MSTKITYNGGGFFTLLFITFLILKLCNVINWSWWWVTAPLWGSFCIFIICVLIYLLILIIAIMLKHDI